jgi:hypothetical protein
VGLLRGGSKAKTKDHPMNLKTRLIPLAIWTKTNSHTLRAIGCLFFILSLLAGIAWVFGANIEPIAFTLGLFASIFLSSPSIAEYIYPNRKAISQMSAAEILEFIKTTNPKSDWKRIPTNWAVETYLIEDPRLRFRYRFDEEGIHDRQFQEPWASRHPDPNATSYWCYLYYDSALIDRYVLVSVDGGRALIPLPRQHIGNEIYPSGITDLEFQIGKIHDYLETFDEYMERCGLTMVATTDN